MIRSGSGQLEEFKKSIIWLDILDELEVWLKDVHVMLENQDRNLTHMELDRLGGNAEAFHKFESVLDYLINNIEVEQQERELKREKENE